MTVSVPDFTAFSAASPMLSADFLFDLSLASVGLAVADIMHMIPKTVSSLPRTIPFSSGWASVLLLLLAIELLWKSMLSIFDLTLEET